MLNNLDFYSNNSAQNHSVVDAKYVHKKNKPYRIYPSSDARDENFAIITEEFIPKMRFALTYNSNGNIAYMSGSEVKTWFDFIDYQDGKTSYEEKDELAVAEMDRCLMSFLTNETTNEDVCRTEAYIQLIQDTIFN